MKVQYVILLVAVALEASLSMWPNSGSFVSATDDETVVIKPTKKGKNPKIRRTIRVRESIPPSPSSSPFTSAPSQAAPVQQAPAQPISNEVHVKPDISVQVSPQQQQQHYPQQQQHQQYQQQQPQPQPQPQFQEQLVHSAHDQPAVHPAEQQMLVEKPHNDDDHDDYDDDADDDKNDDDDDDDDDHKQQVKAENMQIVPHQPSHVQPNNIVPVPAPVPAPEITTNPHLNNPMTQVTVDVGGEQPVFINNDNNSNNNNNKKHIHELTDPKNNHNINANIINNRRYNPIGWPTMQSNLVAAPTNYGYGYPLSYQAAQPMIPVNIDSVPAVQMALQSVATPFAPSPASMPLSLLPSSPSYVAGPAVTPLWQGQSARTATGFYPVSPVGAATGLPSAANLYQQAAVYPSNTVNGAYYGYGYGQAPPLMQAAPAMVMAAAQPAMMQPQPIMMQAPTMMMMQVPAFQQSFKMMKKPKKSPNQTKKQVVIEQEEEEDAEPIVESKTTWIKKEPQFNQYVEEKPVERKVVEIKKPVEEVEWETVRIPKIKKKAAAAISQH